MTATVRQLHALMDKLEPDVRDAFIRVILAVRGRTNIGALTEALRNTELQEAMIALGFRDGSFGFVQEAVRQSYIEAGTFTMATDVPVRFGLEFNWQTPVAQEWLLAHSSKFITETTAEQIEVIREALEAGLRANRNPRRIALDIAGRIDKRTGRRTGGLVGLNRPQARAARGMRQALTGADVGVISYRPDGKPVKGFWIGTDGRLKSRYSLRDRRFDPLIKRAIENGERLTDAKVDQLLGRYEDTLLRERGTTIARTEVLESLNMAREHSLVQALDETGTPEEAATRIWDATGDSRTRETHARADGQERGPTEAFEVGGFPMMFPGDSTSGAPAREIINCRCVVRHDIDFGMAALAQAGAL